MTDPDAWRYPCYCLPGAARCDDPTACDRTAAPDAAAGDGLRDAIARKLAGGSIAEWWAAGAPNVKQPFLDTADDILALPALRDVLAAAARDAEKVRAVRELHVSDQCWYCENKGAANCPVMRALDPS